jgi:hypothetical protein
MLGELSTRGDPAGLEPVGARVKHKASGTSRSPSCWSVRSTANGSWWSSWTASVWASTYWSVRLASLLTAPRSRSGGRGHHRAHCGLYRAVTGLRDRGLDPERGLLFVIDGAKALAAAIRGVVDPKALIQRCRVHGSRKESSCWCVVAGCCGGEEFGGGAVADGRRGWDAAVLFQEGPGLADGVADGGAADVA